MLDMETEKVVEDSINNSSQVSSSQFSLITQHFLRTDQSWP